MRRHVLVVVVGLVAAMSLSSVAGAGKFHFRDPQFTGGSLIFTGTAVGLGNSAHQFDLEASASVIAICANKGGNQAQGVNALPVLVASSTTATSNTNGQAPITIVIEDPTIADFDQLPTSREAGCPNGNWSVVDVTLLEWTAAHLEVTDLSTGNVVYDALFNCSGVGATLSCVAAA